MSPVWNHPSLNAEASGAQIRRWGGVHRDAFRLLEAAVDRLHLSARSYDRMLKVARTIADLAGDVVSPRVRLLFLIVVLVGLWIVLAVFGLVIAIIFSAYPSAVLPSFAQIPIAVGLGVWLRRGGGLLLGTIIAVVLMYGSIAWSASSTRRICST